MRDIHVNVVDRDPALLKEVFGRLDEDPGGELEHFWPVHLDVFVGIIEEPRAAARQPEIPAAGAVRSELEAEKAFVGDDLEHNRAGAVTKEDERRTVVPI